MSDASVAVHAAAGAIIHQVPEQHSAITDTSGLTPERRAQLAAAKAMTPAQRLALIDRLCREMTSLALNARRTR